MQEHEDSTESERAELQSPKNFGGHNLTGGERNYEL